MKSNIKKLQPIEKTGEPLPQCQNVAHPEMVRNSVEEVPCDDGTGKNSHEAV